MMVVRRGLSAVPPEHRSWRRIPTLVLRSFQIVAQAAPREFAMSVGVQLLQGAALGVNLLIVRSLLSALISGSGRHDYRAALVQLAILVGVQTMSGLLGTYQAAQQQVLTELVQRHATRPITEVATTIGLRDFDTPQFHDRMQRAQQTAVVRPQQVTQAVFGIGRSAFGVAGVAVGLLLLSPILLVLSLAGFVPLAIATSRVSKAVFEFMCDMTANDRRRAYVLGLLTTREMAKEIRAFDLAGYLRSIYDQLTDDRVGRLRDHVRQRAALSLLGSLGTALATGVTFGALAYLTLSGRLGLAEAGAAAMATIQLSAQVQGVVLAGGQLYESSLFIEDLQAFLAQLPRLRAATPRAPAPRGFERIEVRDVHFTYPAASHPRAVVAGAQPGSGPRRPQALSGVSLEIGRGEVVALVGENGSGKTTLAKVISGLYPPDHGQVLWDGIDIATVDPAQLRDQMTVIFQDFVRYWLTVRENVGLGRVDRLDDAAAIRSAAEIAGAHGFIERLPDGYETSLGPIFDGGKDLSMGQWQRIALARAFFRDAPLIILDEPTAALDARAEAELFDRIRSLFAGRAVLLISHRFSSVRSADCIYVLKDGEVVEHGTHRDLLSCGGLYAELFGLQAAAYLDLTEPTKTG